MGRKEWNGTQMNADLRSKRRLFWLGGVIVAVVLVAGLVARRPAEALGSAQEEQADPVFVGAGDIALCASSGDEATAALLDTISGTVWTAGDNVYDTGTAAEFTNCYDPSWGRHKARTRPTPGNHDYGTPGATGYYGYFGAAAGDPAKGYYSYELGAWHIIALNSEIAAGAGSAQEQWLRADLAAHPTACTLAYWHKPLYSSGEHGNNPAYTALWQALYEYGADVVIGGHDHNYERFAPQNASGAADAGYGLREFVVGTGGRSLRPFGTVQANSEVRDFSTAGVLKLTLHPTSYDWEFVPVAGGTFTDTGAGQCHASPEPPPVDVIFLSTLYGGMINGIGYSDEDILSYNNSSGVWAMYFDGSDVGLGASNVDDFALQADGSLLLSFVPASTTVPGLGAVDDSDIVRFIPSSTGSTTAGTFAWYFDGSDVGLTTDGEDVDGVALTADGKLLISTGGAIGAGGLTGQDEDLFAFTPTALGQTTSGSWAMYFDGSDVGLQTTAAEDVNGVWLDMANGRLFLTTVGAFSVTNSSGDGSDVFICAPGSLGNNTTCTFGPGLYFDGSVLGIGNKVIDGLDIVRQ